MDSVPRAVLFDAYGTLFDVHSVGALAEQTFVGQGAALSQLWRLKQIEYTHLCSMAGRYQPFSALTRASLRFACAQLRLPLDAASEERLLAAYDTLSPFAENREVLLGLRERGVRTGILSNGDPEMLARAVRSAGFDELLDPVLSVHETARFKTDPVCYALGPQALGLPARDILFVSSNGWDAIGATWFGYTTLWVNRLGAPLEELGTPPTRIGQTLRDVFNFF